jgi:hypothetical protein
MTRELFTARSTDPLYNSPLIGNGEVVTTLGPTGYHNGRCPEEEAVNRSLFWAGRRLSNARGADIRIPRVPPEELIGPTKPLLRLGRFRRALDVNGARTTDENWQQSLDYGRATVTSVLFHGALREQTRSLVCLTKNLIVFHTRLENTGSEPLDLLFSLEYEFGDARGQRPPGTRLNIRRPHPDDLPFGNVEGTRSLAAGLAARQPHLLESLSVQYEVESHLGEVRIGRSPAGPIQPTALGGRFVHTPRLDAGQSADLWFWASLSDRTKFMHFPPDLESVQSLMAEHETGWAKFWQNGQISLGEPELEAVYQAGCYTLRCNASPFTVPVGNLSTHWEGRILHDDFFMFLGLAGGNHLDLAHRVVQHRINTLPTALRRGNGQGAYFGWEVTEDGEESAPYGHWTDEQFRHGQISEAAWRYYLYTGDRRDLERVYPLLRGCADWLVHDAVIEDEAGSIRTRLATDVQESFYPVRNSIYLSCATICALNNAARAAELLGIDPQEQEHWRRLATGLGQNLPVDQANRRYRYADNAEAPLGYAHSAMVFPFHFDVHGDLALSTVDQVYQAFSARRSQPGAAGEEPDPSAVSDNWIWQVSGLACALFYQGRGDAGLDVLRRVPSITGPFMAPNEHFRGAAGAYLPWFGTGAGAYASAIQSMFVQVWHEAGTVLLPAMPAALSAASFHNLLAAQRVTVSGEVRAGKLVRLSAFAPREMKWQFCIPQAALEGTAWPVSKPDTLGRVTVECALSEGVNTIL